MQDVLFALCELPQLAPGLTPMVELTLCQKPGQLVVQFVNGSGVWGNSCFAPLPVQNITLRLPGVRAAKAAALRGGQTACRITGNNTILTLNVLNEYEAIVLEK